MQEDINTGAGPAQPQSASTPQPTPTPQTSPDSGPSPDSTPANQPTPQPKENYALGLIGAVLGSLLGVVAIILFDRLGYVAAVSGLIMALGTLGLYKKFAKGISTKGIVICIVVIIFMTLLAENIAFSIKIVEELKEYGITATFGEIFGNFYQLIAEDVIDGGIYAFSLFLVYAFTAIGAFSIIKSSFKK